MVERYRSKLDVCYVYWLYNETCSVPENDGYVGVSINPDKRLKSHRRSKAFVPGFQMEILFKGTSTECVLKEIGYRPLPGIGWNTYSGGKAGRKPHPSSVEKMRRNITGLKRKPETCEAISRYQRNRPPPTEETKQKIREKRALQVTTDETCAKMSASQTKRHAEYPMPEEQRQAIAKRMEKNQYGKGTVFSEEELQRRSEFMIGNDYGSRPRVISEKGHAAMSANGKKPKSKETRLNISGSRRRFLAEHGAPKHSRHTKAKQSKARKRWCSENKDKLCESQRRRRDLERKQREEACHG